MKHVLYIAFFFPPIGGAGVQRSLKFTRYLPLYGWSPSVLTAEADYWMRDPSLLDEIDPGTRVVRVSFAGGRFLRGLGRSGSRSQSRIRLLRSLSRFVLIPDAYVGWVGRAARAAEAEMAARSFNALLTTSSPDSVHLLGRRLKRKWRVPWVADFRDPWTRRLSYRPPTPLHHSLQKRLEQSCLHEADRVVVTTEETKEDFLRLYTGLSERAIRVIPNGYDEEDFIRALEMPVPGSRPAILHAGQLNPERSLAPYLTGLKDFLDRHPDQAPEVGTVFQGAHYDRHVQEAARFGLTGSVEFRPPVPHGESIATLLHARVLLLLEQNSERGRLVLPGKVFEYLRAGRPILAVVPPDGAAARMVREYAAGWVADPARPETVAEGLEQLLDRSIAGPPAGIDRYERKKLTGDLASVLDDIS